MESGLEARGQESETTNPCAVQVVITEEGSPARIPVFSIYEEISQDLCGRSHSSLARQRDEERKLEGTDPNMQFHIQIKSVVVKEGLG